MEREDISLGRILVIRGEVLDKKKKDY